MKKVKKSKNKGKVSCKGCILRNNNIRKYKMQLRKLQDKLDELNHPITKAGLQGEDLIVKITKGDKTKFGMPHDIELKNGDKVEVKFSKPNIPVPGSKSVRWTWHHIFGNKRLKKYKWLILIGEQPKNEQLNKEIYPYTYFLIPRSDVRKIVDSIDKRGHINFIIDPLKKTWSKTREKLLKYEIKHKEMRKFFKQLTIREQKKNI